MYEYHVKKVLKIVDGDTIDVEIDLGFSVSFTQRVRLAGIDTPESRTTDLKEKALGLEVKEYLKNLLDGAEDIVIQTEKPDSSEKYGRILGWLFINDDDTSLNEKMINDGYAWEYDGGTKKKDFGSLLAKRSNS
jgi:micrococcal nuclease